MATGYIPLKLSEADIDAIAERIAARLGGAPAAPPAMTMAAAPVPVAQPVPQAVAAAPPDDDPWLSAQPATQAPPPVAAQPAPTPVATAATPTPQASGKPQCKHGEMRYVPAGVAKSGPRAGQPYDPFWACPAPRGAPDKCPTVRL